MTFWKTHPLGRAVRYLAYLSFDAGTQAIALYRIGNWIYRLRIPVIPLFIERFNLLSTGASIASSAQIGKCFDLKHTVGVVIGQTAVIGDHVIMLHGVTLGSIKFDERGKRHPTIEDGVMIGAGATVIGEIIVGRYSRIGAGAIVTRNVPPYSVIVGPKATIIKSVAPNN